MGLFLGLLCSSYSNSQTTDSVTGNLTNFTGSPTDTTGVWNNAGSVGQQLTCWEAGGSGYCGPNPRVSAWGAGSNVINFSYGLVDLNQIVNINKALAISGSVVQLSGFNFGFTAKNGNGWDNGAQDYLSAYVKLYGSSGNQVAAYDYTSQTNKRYNWTTFNFSETFATPYTASTMGNAQYGFVGRDNNFWVGPYGPEIKDVNFSLKYSTKPDPCIADPLSSPTCPGYALATVKNSILGSTVAGASVTSYIPTTNYGSPAPAAAAPDPTNPAPQQGPAPAPGPQGPVGPAPGPGQDPNQNPSVAQDNPSQPSPQQAGPAPTGPQPAGGPPQTTQTASAPPPSAGPQQAGPQQGGGGAGPSKLAMSVVKTAQANDKATQQMAVQNAAKAFEGTVQSSNAASNAAVSMNQDMSANSATAAAQFSSQTTQASQQTTTQSTQVSQQQQQQTNAHQQQTNKSVQQVQQTTTVSQQVEIQSTSVVMLKPPAQVATESQQQSSGTGITVNKNTIGYNPLASFTVSNMSSPVAQTAPVYQPRIEARPVDADTPPMQVASFGGIGRAGNPLSEMMMQQRFELMQENIQQQTSSVNRNVQPNDLAGGVDLASMATVPQGFNAYSFVLKDAAFYEPKEVYKNQKVVDNVQVLRQMSSDSLHKQMVDQQYK